MVRLNDRPDMTIAVDWDIKNQTRQTNICLDTKNQTKPKHVVGTQKNRLVESSFEHS